ncbi:hypothetical protein SCLCIDRAFT_37885, partial [Scleroderma citrinum Foug A]
KKYYEANKTLGATGAGHTAEELKENPDMKKLLMFPIQLNFHGYWRMNLTYNTVYTTGNPGQYFEVEVL